MPDKQEFSLYNGEVVLSFAEKSHRYKVSDRGSKPEHCPSVTTILNVLAKPALVEWGVKCACNYVEENLRLLFAGESFSVEQIFKIVEAARTAHDRTRQEAADIGTSAHDWLADYWRAIIRKTDIPELPEEGKIRNCVDAALSWFSEHKLEPVVVENALYSRIFQFCGRPDFIGFIDGQVCVLDYKSTKNLYPEIALQMAAYACMHEEEAGNAIGKIVMPGAIVKARWGLRLDKETGEFEARKYDNLELDWETFLSVFRIYDRMKHLRRKEKKSKDFLEGL